MKPLKKGLEASEEKVIVTINDKKYTCANLKRSGIVVKSKILVAHEEVWHELDILGLGKTAYGNYEGLQNSNLYNFKNVIEQTRIVPDLPIFSNTSARKSYDLTYEDRMALDEAYGFSYIYIEHLEKHLIKNGMKAGMYQMKEILAHIKKQGRTIQEYINNNELQAKEIINNSKKVIKMGSNLELKQTERINFLTSLGFVWNDQDAVYVCRYGTAAAPARFEVSLKSIEDDNDENWSKLVERIQFSVPTVETASEDSAPETESETTETVTAEPITETQPAKKPVSLSVIGGLSADRITEFQDIKATQEKIVKDNPFVAITDKDSYETAKKSRAVLLKASTAIDGAKGHKANKNKFLKQISERLDLFLDSMAKLTRTGYDKQDLEVKRWESEEALRIQKEQKAEMEKVKKRTDELFAVPMVFNGTHYVIGNLHIMPSQIKDSTDEVFQGLVAQAVAIKAGLDAAESANKAKDEEIAALKAMLAKLTGEPVQPAEVKEATEDKPVIENKPSSKGPMATGKNIYSTPNKVETPKSEVSNTNTGTIQNTAPVNEHQYTEVHPDNVMLLALDLENLAHIENKNYLKCRHYYIKGLNDAAKEINKIFASDHPKKSEPIKALVEIMLNAK